MHVINQVFDTPYKSEELLIKTLLKMKTAGLEESTVRTVNYRLTYLAKHTDLTNPDAIKLFIANLPNANSYKQQLINAYNYVCVTNGMKWEKPKYRVTEKIPLIPTTANVNKIISASTKKYATIFTILKETGLEAHELATMQRQDIDTELGIITAQGCKGHAPRAFKLRPATKAMLTEYLNEHTDRQPFPPSRFMSCI